MATGDTPEEHRVKAPPGALARWWGAIGSRTLAERDRWILWLPAALGLGVAVYFQLPQEPPA